MVPILPFEAVDFFIPLIDETQHSRVQRYLHRKSKPFGDFVGADNRMIDEMRCVFSILDT